LWLVLGIITATSLLSMYGLFMVIAARGDWPSFFGLGSPTSNPLSGAIHWIYTSDVFITIFACLLLLAVLALLGEVIHLGLRRDPSMSKRQMDAAPEPAAPALAFGQERLLAIARPAAEGQQSE